MAKTKVAYVATVGIDYPPNKRVEAGDTVDDLPTASLPWLKEQGLIVPADEAAADEATASDGGEG